MFSNFKKKHLLVLIITAPMFGSLHAADIDKGKGIAKRICAACHGKDGVSRAPVIPNLSGQKAEYIIKQLQDFKSGKRSNNSMEGIAANLNDKDMSDVAAYYAAHGAVEDTSAKVTTATLDKVKDKLTVCMPCHGTNGIGTSPQFPNLAGQKDRYLLKQLEKFQKGKRKDATMAPIAAQLSKNDIKALGKYFSKVGKVKINK